MISQDELVLQLNLRFFATVSCYKDQVSLVYGMNQWMNLSCFLPLVFPITIVICGCWFERASTWRYSIIHTTNHVTSCTLQVVLVHMAATVIDDDFTWINSPDLLVAKCLWIDWFATKQTVTERLTRPDYIFIRNEQRYLLSYRIV